MRKHTRIKLTAFATLLLCICTVAAVFSHSASAEPITGFCVDMLSDNDGDGIITDSPDVAYPDDRNMIYMTSSADPSHLRVMFTSDNVVSYCSGDESGSGTVIESGDYIDITGCAKTDISGKRYYSVIMLTDGNFAAQYTFHPAGELCSVYIKTSIGQDGIDGEKTVDEGIKVIIAGRDGKTEYSNYPDDTFSSIKGRGNATWSYAKKAYKLKLGASADIDGMGKDKNWLLIANYIDQSMIRNALAYELADRMGMMYAPDFTYADVYIDNQYRGVYMLTEKIEIDEDRVNIENLEKATEKLKVTPHN